MPIPAKPITRDKLLISLCENRIVPEAYIPSFAMGWLEAIGLQGEWFDFGRIDNDVLNSFRMDVLPFLDEGLIKLPYSKVVWRVRVGNGGIAFPGDMPKDSESLLLCEEHPVQGLRLSLVIYDGTPEAELIIKSMVVLDKLGMRFPNPECDETPSIESDMEGYGQVACYLLLALWAILNTRNIDKTVDIPSDKLNRARVKAGKSPLRPVTRVNAEKYVTALRETERMEKESKGGTHASPRMHLRRGHLRTLDGGRRIWVHATIVNASAGAEASGRLAYRVVLKEQDRHAT